MKINLEYYEHLYGISKPRHYYRVTFDLVVRKKLSVDNFRPKLINKRLQRPVRKTFIPLSLSESFTGAANSLREF
jgi:hypothetical protein